MFFIYCCSYVKAYGQIATKFKNMIWTEEENEIRQIDNIMKPEGKSCINCQWSNADKGEKLTTCGHHLQNFSTNSFCGYWTSKNDPKVKAYFDRRKKELKDKINARK
jgi:hypothetical protein